MTGLLGALLMMLGALAHAQEGLENPPLPGELRSVKLPEPVETTLANGLRVIVVERPGLPLLAAQLVVKSGGEVDPAEGELEQALDRCLRELPEKQRRLILARYAPGASVQDLAAERNQTPTALSLTLLRIRKALESCVERKLATS